MAIDIRIGDDKPKEDGPEGHKHRPFLGVKFICANMLYVRFYKTPDGREYAGRCPKCLKQVHVGIASHGTNSRFFSYDCGIY